MEKRKTPAWICLAVIFLLGGALAPVARGEEPSSAGTDLRRDFRTLNFWPLLYVKRSDEETRTLIWSIYDYAPPLPSAGGSLIPLQLYSRHSSSLDDSSGLHILGLYHRLRQGDRHTTLLLPFMYRTREPGSVTTVAGPVLPLLWHVNDRPGNRKYLAVVPFYLSKRTSAGSLTVAGPVLPLFWQTENTEKRKKSIAVLPVYFSSVSPSYKKSFALFPLPHYHGSGPDREFNTWFPLYWFWRNPHGRTAVFLTYFRHTGDRKTKWGILPFATGGCGRGYSSWGAPLLLSWGHRDRVKASSSFNLLAPLGYMHSRTVKTEFRSLLFPLGYVYSRKDDSEWTLKTPLYMRFRNPRKDLAVLMVLGYRDRDRKKTAYGIAPFLRVASGDRYSSAALYPLAWGHRDGEDETSSLFILPPLGYMYDRKRDTLFRSAGLLYWHWSGPYSRTTLLLPYYKRVSEWGTATSILPLAWWLSDGTRRSFIFFPLVWSFRDSREETESFTVLPLYHHNFRGEDREEGYAFLFPLYYFRKTRASEFSLFALLAYQHRNDERIKEGFFPLVWHTESDFYTSLAILPFYHYKRDEMKESTSRTLFPLYHHSRTPEKELRLGGAVMPLAISYRTPDYRFWAVPFYWRFTASSGASRFGIFPVPFWYGRGEEYTFHAFIPLYYYFRNTAKDEQLFISLPYFRRKLPGREFRQALLLHWYFRNEVSELSIWGPYYVNRFEERVTRGIFPVSRWEKSPGFYRFHAVPFLVWGERDSEWDTRKFAFLPFYYLNRNQESKLEMKTPLWWHHKDEKHRLDIIPPLFLERRKSEIYGDFTTFGLFPFLWIKSGEDYSSISLFPVAGRYRDGKTGSHGSYLFPLWMYHDTGSSVYGMATPFFWNYRGDNGRAAAVLGLVPHVQDGELQRVYPVLRVHSPEYAFDMLTPVFWKYRNKASGVRFTMLLFPLLSGARVNMALPFYSLAEGDDIAYGLFPVLRFTRKGDYSSFFSLVPPVWGHRDRSSDSSSLTVFPFYYRYGSDDENILFTPLYYRRESPERTMTSVIPLLYSSVKTPGRRSWLQFPLAWGHRDTDNGTRSWNILPLLMFYSKTPDSKTRAYIPLFHWHSSGPDRMLSVYGPYYRWENSGGYARTGVFPLYWNSADGGYRSKGVLPFYWMADDPAAGRYSSTLLPVYHRSRSAGKGFGFTMLPLPVSVPLTEGFSVPLPPVKLNWYDREKDMRSTHYLLGPVPLVQDKRIGSEARITSVLWYLYRRTENYRRKKVTVEIPWLYARETIDGEVTYRAWFGRLYVYDRVNRERIYLFFIRKKINQDRPGDSPPH